VWWSLWLRDVLLIGRLNKNLASLIYEVHWSLARSCPTWISNRIFGLQWKIARCNMMQLFACP
jgi:hypothetical protein